MRSFRLGRHVFGGAALASGLVTLVWHNYRDWDELRSLLNAASGPVFVYAAAAAQIFGGAALQFRRAAKTGAFILTLVYLLFALLFLPRIAAAPRSYDPWGNVFEQFSLVIGAAIIYAPAMAQRLGRILLGLCTASFAIEQAVYFAATKVLVPRWLPPNQAFWAAATTLAFALAALALLANRRPRLAAWLLTSMLALFGLLVWVPLVVSHPRSHTNWSECVETFTIAGTAWILADWLTT